VEKQIPFGNDKQRGYSVGKADSVSCRFPEVMPLIIRTK
jgi:hypothetical protein